MSVSLLFCLYGLKVDKALTSIEEEAEKIFEGELGLLLEDEPSHARNAMLVPL